MHGKKLITLLLSSALSVSFLGQSAAVAASELKQQLSARPAVHRVSSTVTTSVEGAVSIVSAAKVSTVTADTALSSTPPSLKALDEGSTYTTTDTPTLNGLSPTELYIDIGQYEVIDISSNAYGSDFQFSVSGYDTSIISVTYEQDFLSVCGIAEGTTTITVSDQHSRSYEATVHVMGLENATTTSTVDEPIVTSLPGEIEIDTSSLHLSVGDYYSYESPIGYIGYSFLYSSTADPRPYVTYDSYYVDVEDSGNGTLTVTARNPGYTEITVAYNELGVSSHTVDVYISRITTTVTYQIEYIYDINSISVDLDQLIGFYRSDEDSFDLGQISSCYLDLGITETERGYYSSYTDQLTDRIDVSDSIGFGDGSPALTYDPDNETFAYDIPLYYSENVYWYGRYSSYQLLVAQAGDPVLSNGEQVYVKAYIGKAGDTDLNGRADALDSALILNYYAKLAAGGHTDTTQLSSSPLAAGVSSVYEEFAAFLSDIGSSWDSSDRFATKSSREINSVDAQIIMDSYADQIEKLAGDLTYSDLYEPGYPASDLAGSAYKPQLYISDVDVESEGYFSASIQIMLDPNGDACDAVAFFVKIDERLQVATNSKGQPDVVCDGVSTYLRTKLLPGNVLFITASGCSGYTDSQYFTFSVERSDYYYSSEEYPIQIVYPDSTAASPIFRSASDTDADKLAEAWLYSSGVSNGRVVAFVPTTTTTTTTMTTTTYYVPGITSTPNRPTTTTLPETTTYTTSTLPVSTAPPTTAAPQIFIDKVVPQNLTMVPGETQQATLIWSDPDCNKSNGFAPGVRLSWSISDESIVSVGSDGKIIALAPGTARITFYSAYPRLDTPESTITVTVQGQPIATEPVVTAPGTSSSTSTSTTSSSATTVTTTKLASVAELRDMAKRDYKEKTGVYPDSAAATTLDNGLVEIKLYDEQGSLLETYTVDPYTGLGLTAGGMGVELPQTGNSDPTDLALMLGALALITAGAFMILRSRRRKYEQ
ncbi:MAG: cellulose-binding protein CttA-related protein [Ruminococcus sp.]|nr:cellulose-binding protein CttA-related protein [Ruminococcus sp.]